MGKKFGVDREIRAECQNFSHTNSRGHKVLSLFQKSARQITRMIFWVEGAELSCSRPVLGITPRTFVINDSIASN